MLHVYEDVVFPCSFKQLLVMFKQFDSRLCYEHVDPFFNCVQRDREMGCVRREDGDYGDQPQNDPFREYVTQLALPFGKASIAALYASGLRFPCCGYSSKDTSSPL